MRGALNSAEKSTEVAPVIGTSDLYIRNSADPDKSFIINILTSNPLQLKILQTLLANPAPVEALEGIE
jgi:hypothetical protein